MLAYLQEYLFTFFALEPPSKKAGSGCPSPPSKSSELPSNNKQNYEDFDRKEKWNWFNYQNLVAHVAASSWIDFEITFAPLLVQRTFFGEKTSNRQFFRFFPNADPILVIATAIYN